MAEPFIGEIILFGGNFAPRGYALCDGQLLAISSNDALFALIGTLYGGDGRTTFALPDLRGRAPLHRNSGPGLTPRTLGSSGGDEAVSISVAQMPRHRHVPQASADEATASIPGNSNSVLADGSIALYGATTPAAVMHADAIGNAGGGQGHNNMMPFLTVNYCIALFGTFPSRN